MIVVNDGASRRTSQLKSLADKAKIQNEVICVLLWAQSCLLTGQTLD